ncbi:hypothetical protein MP228_011438 [Amoeboaphelidium protococcarum]|nr:hypothetical protein MP228_011438 [Amoeboaphelidium protococcarum]
MYLDYTNVQQLGEIIQQLKCLNTEFRGWSNNQAKSTESEVILAACNKLIDDGEIIKHVAYRQVIPRQFGGGVACELDGLIVLEKGFVVVEAKSHVTLNSIKQLENSCAHVDHLYGGPVRGMLGGPLFADNVQQSALKRNIHVILLSGGRYKTVHFPRDGKKAQGGYLIKQTFAIPGSGLLNLLAGALFGHLNAWFLVNTLTAVGSTLSYMLSWLFLSEIIERISFLKRQVSKFKGQVETARKNNDLLTYMLFIRMFPFTPNWLVNIASPHVDVPVWPFFISMLIGTSPYSFITTGSGKMLNEIESLNNIFQPKHLATIALMALVIMILPMLKKRVQSSVDAKSD